MRWWRAAPLAMDTDQHMVTIAESRFGKDTSAIMTNLHFYTGSVVCLDLKG
jgi:type IV secretory pathway TraG/TraD family ATPase VirD4